MNNDEIDLSDHFRESQRRPQIKGLKSGRERESEWYNVCFTELNDF